MQNNAMSKSPVNSATLRGRANGENRATSIATWFQSRSRRPFPFTRPSTLMPEPTGLSACGHITVPTAQPTQRIATSPAAKTKRLPRTLHANYETRRNVTRIVRAVQPQKQAEQKKFHINISRHAGARCRRRKVGRPSRRRSGCTRPLTSGDPIDLPPKDGFRPYVGIMRLLV